MNANLVTSLTINSGRTDMRKAVNFPQNWQNLDVKTIRFTIEGHGGHAGHTHHTAHLGHIKRDMKNVHLWDFFVVVLFQLQRIRTLTLLCPIPSLGGSEQSS